jgi:catechol 2,3-dioxygenase-like lactoylglutathione lyase family enzyme
MTLKSTGSIVRLHHVQLTVPKGEESAARNFYCNVLKLNEIEKPPSLQGRGGLWLALGDIQIHIGTEDNVDRRATKGHIAYQVDDLASWHRTLTENNIEILDSVPIPGYLRFEFRDPFGNRVEMIQPVK